MIEIETAWAAGLFDGEGCISISKVTPSQRNDIRNNSYRLVAKVTMGHRPTVEKFGSIVCSGSFQFHVAQNDRVNASYSWVAMSRKAEVIVRMLRRYLLTKAEEADIALQFMALPDVERGGRGGSKRIDPILLAKKEDLYQQCRRLKSRFRFRKEAEND